MTLKYNIAKTFLKIYVRFKIEANVFDMKIPQ